MHAFHGLALAGLAKAVERIVEQNHHSLIDMQTWAEFEADQRGLPSYAADVVLRECPLYRFLGYTGEEPFASSDWDWVVDHPAVVAFEERRRKLAEFIRSKLPPSRSPSDLVIFNEVAKQMWTSERIGELAERPLFALPGSRKEGG